MKIASPSSSTITADNRFLDVEGRRLAYRVVGGGRPLVLALRFRGIMDSWDPAFIDALARHFTVVTFDYSGLGLSTGTPSYDPVSLAADIRDLVRGLELGPVVLAGWSIGGAGVQVAITEHPELASHAVLIGTFPPGELEHGPEPIFRERALRQVNDLEDETILFFEPASEASRKAATESHERIAQRTKDRSIPVPTETFTRLMQAGKGKPIFPDVLGTREKLTQVHIPILNLCADHDVAAPVENWYARIREVPTMQTVVFSHAGHGPQHQLPEVCSEYIAAFVRTTSRTWSQSVGGDTGVHESTLQARDGVGLFTRRWTPTGTPRAVVVLVHGFKAHGGLFDWAGAQMAMRGLATYALDLRGHGKSAGERLWVEKFTDYTADVDAVVSEARRENPGLPVFVLGHSAGGVIACMYAIEHQQELAGLVCESFAHEVPTPDFALAVLKGVSHIAPHLHVLKLEDEGFSRDSAFVQRMKSDPLIAREGYPAHTVAEMVRADEYLKREGFAATRLPVLILHGTADRVTVPHGSQVFDQRGGSKDKTLRLYEGHFHDLLNDLGRERVLADVVEWIVTRARLS